MTQETIYLCYEADKWISRESKQLIYKLAHSMPIILYFWSFCLTPEPQV